MHTLTFIHENGSHVSCVLSDRSVQRLKADRAGWIADWRTRVTARPPNISKVVELRVQEYSPIGQEIRIKPKGE